MDADVIVVGAGIAGLRCATRLLQLGRDVIVLEQDDAVGGRVRTDVVDGFRCDRGFQVLNPAYPAMKRWVDLDALDLAPFCAGVLVRRSEGLVVVADPRREPRLLGATLRSGYVRPLELAALGRWAARVLADPAAVKAQPDRALADSFDAAGVTGRVRAEVLDPFLAGVLVDSHGRTSANFTKLLVRSFVLGRPGVPRLGMGALPEQLAAPLGGRVRLGARVERVSPAGGGVELGVGGTRLTARAAVVATEPVAAASLSGIRQPEMRGLVTWWFEAPEAPHPLALIAVDGRRGRPSGAGRSPGPVWNAALLTAATPSYAPPGRHLVAATTLLDRPDGEAGEGQVRSHVGEIYGVDPSGWRVVTRHRIDAALPALAPGAPLRDAVAVRDGLFVCGDHRDTPSLQGALVSGHRAAEAVHTHLG
ncbi:MAG: FAD-dependent oxidoreductase [Humibacillus sp.]|nr:FAD-dependent oxidoreductase [Humibacillus sp.]MDN5779195.1 FAD-dependent oxidoreductase [Humibacillus sp.]